MNYAIDVSRINAGITIDQENQMLKELQLHLSGPTWIHRHFHKDEALITRRVCTPVFLRYLIQHHLSNVFRHLQEPMDRLSYALHQKGLILGSD